MLRIINLLDAEGFKNSISKHKGQVFLFMCSMWKKSCIHFNEKKFFLFENANKRIIIIK